MLQHQVAVDIKGLSGTYKKIKDRAVRKKQDIRGEAVLVFLLRLLS